MQRIISFATGNLHRWGNYGDKDHVLRYVKGLGMDGVEMTFASKDELSSYKLSKENEKWLRALPYVTIHYPWAGVNREDMVELSGLLDKVAELYDRIGARNVIIHPRGLPGPEIMGKYQMRFSTENMKKGHNAPIPETKSILDKHPDMGYCIDVSHAYTISKEETGKLAEAFGDRVTQVHLSGTKWGRHHLSMREMSRDFMRSIRPALEMDVPIVIEEDIGKKSERYLKEEVGFIKKMLRDY